MEDTGSPLYKGRAYGQGAYPNQAPMHTAKGIPQLSILEIIYTTRHTKDNPRLPKNSNGCTKATAKDPK